ncbi:hypothetical protein SFRURICE_020992 [Spodoptera frugiperda]|nr:hypothetical protein SFRURICE_020992 [Spodoptera frugiperda]
MVEAQKFRIEQEMTNLVNELDKSYLRKMQGDMHRCAAKCCDDPQTSLERVHGCIENCTSSLNQANNYVQVDKCTIEFEKCAIKCVDKHIAIIPSMMKTMKSVLASGKPPPPRTN